MNREDSIFDDVISPYQELIAYETLWMRNGATLKTSGDNR